MIQRSRFSPRFTSGVPTYVIDSPLSRTTMVVVVAVFVCREALILLDHAKKCGRLCTEQM